VSKRIKLNIKGKLNRLVLVPELFGCDMDVNLAPLGYTKLQTEKLPIDLNFFFCK
jgi:hypothetical protein